MRVCGWRSPHEISSTVMQVVWHGLSCDLGIADPVEWDDSLLRSYDAHIGYGILRNLDKIFHDCERLGIPYFNIDRGYFSPGHYEGCYRISYRGTQARWHEGIPRKPIDIKLEPWRVWDESKPILVCPPTRAVCEFFGQRSWRGWDGLYLPDNIIVRSKGDRSPIEWDKISAVITFNSSVGWQALQRGIPVLSDPVHSIVGSHYAHYGITDMQSLTEKLVKMPDTRMELFEVMAAHQFLLEDIRQGKAWSLISHYLESSSATTVGKPWPPMSAPIPSAGEPKPTLPSSFSSTGN